MPLDTAESRTSHAAEFAPPATSESEQNLMTTARRIALEALEREFRELLSAPPR